MNPTGKYRPSEMVNTASRDWPNQKITQAPIWCSVDLRDGNQALATPMTVSQKLEMFAALVACGFKEIEVGFPAASQTEFDFVRHLIDHNLIPEDVTIQVLVQAKKSLIKRTIESLMGARRVIVHLYNSTSPAQRQIVFGLEKSEVIKLAEQGTRWIKEYSHELTGTEVRLEYSPESFSATEVEFSLEICEAVMVVWAPTVDRPIILNLPETVEVATPNIYADQVEWFCKHLSNRHLVIVSLHTHNDRGTGVAATELGLLAGAHRVEGTLFGNGERTGNLDIVTVALNLFTQGIDPHLELSDLESLRQVYERNTGLVVPARQPYSGDLVFTTFSGSHQDAIRKGLAIRNQLIAKGDNPYWNVPYLTIDPKDIGRCYDEIIRVNSQSGKGGIAYLLEEECGIHLPKDMQKEFGEIAGVMIDNLKREVTSTELRAMLWQEYIERIGQFQIDDFQSITDANGCRCYSVISRGADKLKLVGDGNGPIDAFIKALAKSLQTNLQVLDQAEHTLGLGSNACAIAYIKLCFADSSVRWGAGVDTSIQSASIKAVISALNRK